MPVQCEYYALEGLSRLMETVAAVQSTLNPGLRVTGMLMTMHDARTRVSGDVITEVRAPLPGARVPHRRAAQRAAGRGAVLR